MRASKCVGGKSPESKWNGSEWFWDYSQFDLLRSSRFALPDMSTLNCFVGTLFTLLLSVFITVRLGLLLSKLTTHTSSRLVSALVSSFGFTLDRTYLLPLDEPHWMMSMLTVDLSTKAFRSKPMIWRDSFPLHSALPYQPPDWATRASRKEGKSARLASAPPCSSRSTRHPRGTTAAGVFS